MLQGHPESEFPKGAGPFPDGSVWDQTEATRSLFARGAEYAKQFFGIGTDKREFGAGYKHAGYDVAEAVLRLGGHKYPAVWDLTPRQLSAYLFILDKIEMGDSINRIVQDFETSQGDAKTVNEMLRDIRSKL